MKRSYENTANCRMVGRLLEIVNQAYDLLYHNPESILSQLTEVRKLVHELGDNR